MNNNTTIIYCNDYKESLSDKIYNEQLQNKRVVLKDIEYAYKQLRFKYFMRKVKKYVDQGAILYVNKSIFSSFRIRRIAILLKIYKYF